MRAKLPKARLRELRRLDERDWRASTVVAARRLLADRPNWSEAWLRLGDSLRAMACFREALAALHRGRRLAPEGRRDWVYLLIGRLHDDRGAYRLAEHWYRRAIASSPSEASWYIYLGGMFARRGRLQQAEAMHRRATRCKTGCVDEAFYNLGLVLRAQERYAEARKCLARALQLDPKYRDAREVLADVDHVIERLRSDWRPDPAQRATRQTRRRPQS